MPLPILTITLDTIQHGPSNLKLKGTSTLLIAVRNVFAENIKNRMSLILEAWDIGRNTFFFWF
jgi:hypothetical protein